MKNNRFKKNLIFILIILAISIIVFGAYYLFIEKTNPFVDLIEAITKKNKYDNYNGIYVYTEELDGTYYIYSSCNVSKINNYILIKDENYYVYRSSCIGTFYKEEGKTENLTISVNSNDSYTIKYKDNEYKKDVVSTYIKPENKLFVYKSEIDVRSLQVIVNEALLQDDGYNINDVSIRNIKDFKISLDRSLGVLFIDYSEKGGTYSLYSYPIVDINKLPIFSYSGTNLVIIEQDDNPYDKDMYSYDLIYLTNDGVMYELKRQFPLYVNDVQLSYDSNSIFVSYDVMTRKYTVLVGKDKKMCDDNFAGNKDEIAYYQFSLSFNIQKGTFERLEYVTTGYMSEGCENINKYLGG